MIKTLKTTIGTLFAIVLNTGILSAQSQITEAEYVKQDNLIWTVLEEQEEALSKLWDTMPENQDSLQAEYDKLMEVASAKNIELAKRFATVPSGLQRLYMLRLYIPKDTLKTIFKRLPSEMRNSPYGKNITAHLKSRQIEEGDAILQFPCTREDGTTFDWKSTKGKQLLILYGGLSCMGQKGRDYLSQLYESVSKEAFEIIIYCPVNDLKGLKEWKEQYPFDFVFVSDFKQEASPIKIIYGSQSLPTCFLTDKNHIVKVKCVGIKADKFEKYIPTKE